MVRSRILPLVLFLLTFGSGTAEEPSTTLPIRQEIFRRMAEGQKALESGDAPKAVEKLCWAMRRALNSHDAAWLCGRARIVTRDFDGAIQALNLATEIDPKHLGTWVDLGQAYLGAGRPDQARPAFYKAIELRKDFSPAWDGLARLAWRTGDPAGALDLFAKALEANPADARVRLHRSQLHLEAKRFDQALEDITEAARLRPDDAEVLLGLANIRLYLGLPDLALQTANQARRLVPKDPRPPAMIAQILLALDAPPEAEEAALNALALDPHLASARMALAEAQGRQGRPAEAVAALVPPDPTRLDELEVNAIQKARSRWKQWVDRRSKLEDRAQTGTLAPAERLDLAEARVASGDKTGAEALLAPFSASNDPEQIRRSASVLFTLGRLTLARKILQQLETQGGAGAADLTNLGLLAELTGDAAGALERYQQAAGFPAPPPGALAGLARLALARGDRKEAARQLERFLAANPSPDQIPRSKEALDRLQHEADETTPTAPPKGEKP